MILFYKVIVYTRPDRNRLAIYRLYQNTFASTTKHQYNAVFGWLIMRGFRGGSPLENSNLETMLLFAFFVEYNTATGRMTSHTAL